MAAGVMISVRTLRDQLGKNAAAPYCGLFTPRRTSKRTLTLAEPQLESHCASWMKCTFAAFSHSRAAVRIAAVTVAVLAPKPAVEMQYVSRHSTPLTQRSSAAP